MTALIIQALILILAIILFAILISWTGGRNRDKYIENFFSRKEEHIEDVLEKVSSLFADNLEKTLKHYKTGPWYLVVYTQESCYPLLISNNNIRSIHPDAPHRKLIVKQFNGEDMVIENVEKYVFCAANEMYAHDM